MLLLWHVQARAVCPVWTQHGCVDRVGDAAGDHTQGAATASAPVCIRQQVGARVGVWRVIKESAVLVPSVAAMVVGARCNSIGSLLALTCSELSHQVPALPPKCPHATHRGNAADRTNTTCCAYCFLVACPACLHVSQDHPYCTGSGHNFRLTCAAELHASMVPNTMWTPSACTPSHQTRSGPISSSATGKTSTW
jgi:hypothetical protein